jgi:hypothetical protein
VEAPPLPIVGAVVTQLRFDFAVTLTFDATFHLRVETAFPMAAQEGSRVVLDPETELPDMGSLLTLHQVTVSAAHTDAAGNIRIAFTGGRVLSCAPNSDFEAWTFTGPRGLLYVCLPGGSLAIWDAAG